MSNFKSCHTCSQGPERSQQNVHCPLLMSDGRSFGDMVYSSRCKQQYQAQIDKDIKSSYEYRQYLMNNAEILMKQNSAHAFRTFYS